MIFVWITLWDNYFFPLLLGQKYERVKEKKRSKNIMFVRDSETCLKNYHKMILKISFIKLKKT